jgi:hypothetical protein
MNVCAVTKNYEQLTPEERFRLILAANGRGDKAERDRLAGVGNRINISMQDHGPFAQAFNDVSRFAFIEVLDYSAFYNDAVLHMLFKFGSLRADDLEPPAKAEDTPSPADLGKEEETEVDVPGNAAGDELRDTLLAAGFMLRIRANGWKLFCERLGVPPFALWEHLPGFDRIESALAAAEEMAFVSEKWFLRWLNKIRPAGDPELTKLPLTLEGIAQGFEVAYREMAKWWGGD